MTNILVGLYIIGLYIIGYIFGFLHGQEYIIKEIKENIIKEEGDYIL